MRRTPVLLLLLCLLAPARDAVASDPVILKLATLAPEGTTWHRGLRELGDRWTEISGGAVQVKIYPGGVAGNEESMVRKLRIGQLHGAALTNAGMMLLGACCG